MSNNYPAENTGTSPTPNSGPSSDPGTNRTLIILAAVLSVVAVLALIVTGWAYINRDTQGTAATTTVT